MAELRRIYQCGLCGNVVEVVHAGAGVLKCCDQPMKLLEEQTADAAQEKHVPVIEAVEGGYKVTVGSVPHPMTEEHYIVWIELIADGKSYRQYLKPGSPAEAVFCVEASSVSAREFCNVHGLWKG